jgi:hypothetical protein
MNQPPLTGQRQGRLELLEELHQRYGGGVTGGWRNRLRYWRKRYAWMTVIGGTRLLKRAMDVVFSLAALFLLFPFFVVVGLLI